MSSPSSTELDAFVGVHISRICGCGFHNDNENHCAHFACHILGLRFGATCRGMTGQGDRADSASIRVQEVFERCRRVGRWGDKPASILSGFIFVIAPGNISIRRHTMSNVENKHLGIFVGNTVWQYKNSERKVVKQTPEEFSRHYGPGYGIYYGEFPL
ncbi:MAG: hypothetical protein IPJ30_00225 [Acidobacteria bacterium]|nr:hypothetical protein [Acidobacteriota bacterium]MBK8149729.1 hypothetical protein [Acidobacteriota bacterium]